MEVTIKHPRLDISVAWLAKPKTISAKRLQRLLACFLLFSSLTAALGARAQQQSKAAPLELSYSLRITRPTSHLLEVEIAASKVSEPSLDFVLPAWAPGRYAIYDFAKNIQEFQAVGAQGEALPWTNIDKQTWRVETRNAGGVAKVRYRVFANDLTGSFSQVDSTHANLNGASIFMYVEGHKPDPLALSVDSPKDWKLVSGFSTSPTARSFRVQNYDRLVDTPLEISPDCTVDEFQEAGKTFRIAVHTFAEDDTNRSSLVEGLKKLVRVEMAAMPEPDFQHYTFIFHFAPDVSMGDGMEHLNSTEIIIRGSLQENTPEALETAAHEFFHLWNVKRLRPAVLGPFDYTRENYTKSLWFAEGVTSYFAYVFLYKSGIWTREEFLSHLAEEIRNLEQEPGRALMSAESSSFHAWFYDRSPQMQETNFANTTISYYNKGAVLGMLLDLGIREKTAGAKSLQDVLVAMYKKYYEAAPATYYGPGHGYEEDDILRAVNEVTGGDFSSFFAHYINGTDALPYAEAFNSAGLALRVKTAPGSPPSIGVRIQPENRGVRIVSVSPGGTADRAGLSRDDLLISVDDQSLATEELPTRLKIYAPGTQAAFNVERHGRREIIMVTLDPPLPNEYSIEESRNATPDQVAIRNAWLGTQK